MKAILFGIGAIFALTGSMFQMPLNAERGEIHAFIDSVQSSTSSSTVSSSQASSKGASFDLDKLSVAVAKHETCGCTCGMGKSKNNCHGIMKKSGGGVVFATKEDSHAYFKDMWMRKYKSFPNLSLATIYVCGGSHLAKHGTVPCKGGNPSSWLASVTAAYNK